LLDAGPVLRDFGFRSVTFFIWLLTVRMTAAEARSYGLYDACAMWGLAGRLFVVQKRRGWDDVDLSHGGTEARSEARRHGGLRDAEPGFRDFV
jgi:hypothetical protein